MDNEKWTFDGEKKLFTKVGEINHNAQVYPYPIQFNKSHQVWTKIGIKTNDLFDGTA